MSGFLFGLVCGVVLGGFVVDINVRAPQRVKDWLASWFPGTEAPVAKK